MKPKNFDLFNLNISYESAFSYLQSRFDAVVRQPQVINRVLT